jgi:hypothetical protein
MENKEDNEKKSYEMDNIFNRPKSDFPYGDQEESKSINISHISEVSRSKENSEAYSHQKFKSANLKGEDLRESKNTNSQIYKSNDKTNKLSQHESYIPSKLSSIETHSKENIRNSNSKSKSSSYNKKKTSSKNSDNKVLGKSKSQKQLINKSYSRSKSDISNYSINEDRRNKSRISEKSETFLGDLPLNDESLKFEIMKEVKRIYGNKFDKVIQKNNTQNSNLLEVILKNIKLAKHKMAKLGIEDVDTDDLIVIFLI